MKKTLSVLLTVIFAQSLFAGALCVKLDARNPISFTNFANELKLYAKSHYQIDKFTVNEDNKTIIGERQFKVKKRRKNRMLIGTPVDNFKKKPKWKKEKIEIKGNITKDKVCISVNLEAYNKRTRRWHKLKSDNMLEEHMALFALSKTLKGKTIWSIGNISVNKDGINKRVLNLTKFTVDSVDISVDPSTGIKSVNFNLKDKNGIAVYKVLMIGNVKGLNSALKTFNSHFLDYYPVKKISKIYEFYWAYAKHGEIMDGMHKLQVITALGNPDEIIKKDANKQIFVYNLNGKTYKYPIVKNELSLAEQ